jgi:hypothetical protein
VRGVVGCLVPVVIEKLPQEARPSMDQLLRGKRSRKPTQAQPAGGVLRLHFDTKVAQALHCRRQAVQPRRDQWIAEVWACLVGILK